MAPRGATIEARTRRLETMVGAGVLVVLGVVLAVALIGGIGGAEQGYRLQASFDHIDGLSVGSDVRIAGVKIGRVTDERIDPKTFRANVEFALPSNIRLSTDSSAAIISEGLLGGKYLSITPGGSSQDLPPHGMIGATQGSIGLEALLGKFIGSVTGLMDAVKASNMRGDKGGEAPKPAAPLGDLGQ